ncbi:hypothetical protein [Paraliomyxa miuraensis]|uniref:hypothetical protein n=1 Tax=Paraliomyxa miuraensis TaxID=376150 RepID=UPI00224D4BB2|nr:hypothetical protein [Paraliomyxa miuraensis]MCX4244279.1 hypothetical protein [Paraliomyxa miuraensis]
MRSQDIQIPEPCHADWDAMRPEDRGKFCLQCQTKVHDLSAMTRDEARAFLRGNVGNDVCVSFEHHEDGALVFRQPAPRPAPIVPLSRLRRPRVVAAGMAVGMAAALAACAPHGEPQVRSHAAEATVFQESSVVIPVGEAAPAEPLAEVETVEDEPCDPQVETPETEPERPRVRGRMISPRRTAGKPVVRKAGGLGGYVDPSSL